MSNHCRSKWGKLAGFVAMMPNGSTYSCRTGAGQRSLTCYAIFCNLRGKPLQCITKSIRNKGIGSKLVSLPHGYTMTGGGLYDHHRRFDKKNPVSGNRAPLATHGVVIWALGGVTTLCMFVDAKV
jgi:hypothetical protein